MKTSRLNGRYIRPVPFRCIDDSRRSATAYAQGGEQRDRGGRGDGHQHSRRGRSAPISFRSGGSRSTKPRPRPCRISSSRCRHSPIWVRPRKGNTTPAIHNLGAVSSCSTLVLIDGHRFSLGGQTQTMPDPGILPPSAIERVEVLADAASSVYGSDAVAGRHQFRHPQRFYGIRGQRPARLRGDHYNTLFLKRSCRSHLRSRLLMVTGARSYKSPLFQRYRDFLNHDHRAQGEANFAE